MRDIPITLFTDQTVKVTQRVIGNENEHNVVRFIFTFEEFTSELLEANKYIEFYVNGDKKVDLLDSDNTYTLKYDVMQSSEMQCQVVFKNSDNKEIWKCNIFRLRVNKSLNVLEVIDLEDKTDILNEIVTRIKALEEASGGTDNHAELDNLDYENSGHTGFASQEDLANKMDSMEYSADALPGTLMYRNGNKRAKVAAPLANDEISNKYYTDTSIQNAINKLHLEGLIKEVNYDDDAEELVFIKEDGTEVRVPIADMLSDVFVTTEQLTKAISIEAQNRENQVKELNDELTKFEKEITKELETTNNIVDGIRTIKSQVILNPVIESVNAIPLTQLGYTENLQTGKSTARDVNGTLAIFIGMEDDETANFMTITNSGGNSEVKLNGDNKFTGNNTWNGNETHNGNVTVKLFFSLFLFLLSYYLVLLKISDIESI